MIKEYQLYYRSCYIPYYACSRLYKNTEFVALGEVEW